MGLRERQAANARRAAAAGLLAAGCLLAVAAGVGAASPTGLEAWLPGLSVYGPLAELPAGHWAYRGLERLMEVGLIVEYRPGLLDGERTISRYEAALLLVDAFRRAGALEPPDEGMPPGPKDLKRLQVNRAVARLKVPEDERQRVADILAALCNEFAEELQVLGFVAVGEDGRPAGAPGGTHLRASLDVRLHSAARDSAPSAAPSPSTVPPASSAKVAATPSPERGATAGPETPKPEAVPAHPPEAGASPPEEGSLTTPRATPEESRVATGQGPAPGAARLSGVAPSTYRVGVAVSEPGRFNVEGVVPVGADAGPAEVGAVIAFPRDRWVWARLGRVDSPAGSAFALGDEDLLDLEGIEARLVSNELKTGVVVARGAPSQGVLPPVNAGSEGEEKGPPAIAALDGSLAISRDVVVGAAIVKGASSAEELVSTTAGPAVTSVVTRYRPVPWLTLTGEYAQNMWALPLVSAAMQLDAAVRMGELRLGARIGRVHPEFQSALGKVEPGSRLGVDAAMRLGDVLVKAGTMRLVPPDGGAAQVATELGLRVGSLAGASLRADYEFISVEELASGLQPDRSRTRLAVGWGADKTRLSMGVTWTGFHRQTEANASEPGRELTAEAAIAYQLAPGTTVVLGYRLIDFGKQSDAAAQVSVRF